MNDDERTNPSEISTGDFVELLGGALMALEGAEQEINRLNVFPVPDGDTGTNMRMTLKTSVDELRRQPPNDLSRLAEILAKSSLLGARGNSGVILSQFIKGITVVIGAAPAITAPIWMEAVKRGMETAYAAVRQPVEGTILTVMRAAASVDGNSDDIGRLLAAIAVAARASVEQTPELLPILKENGVVDAGGYGLAVILEGMIAAWRGETINAVALSAPVIPATTSDLTYNYCTEFILETGDINEKDMEMRLLLLGGSLLFVGEKGTYHIHIHTNEPGKVIDLATSQGSINKVTIDNLAQQSLARTQSLLTPPAGIAVVAVAAGEGVKEILISLGAAVIIDGGQSFNPSAEAIIKAIDETNAAQVIVLPNNKNIVLAAEQAASMSEIDVAVVATKSIPAGFAALLAFASEADIEVNTETMTAAARLVKSLAVTTAVRDAAGIKAGDWLGLSEDQVIVVADSVESALIDVVAANIGEDDELLTIITGADMSADTDITALIKSRFPRLDVEVKFGGQPLYPLIMGLE